MVEIGTRITITNDLYGRWIGEHGTVEACPPRFAAQFAGKNFTWAYMDFQAEEYARNPQYARPLPVGLEDGEFKIQ